MFQFFEKALSPALAAIAALAVLFFALQPAPARASQDVTDFWDSICAAYNFDSTQGQSTGATFASAYQGPEIGTDLAAILAEIDERYRPHAVQIPPIDGDDLLLESLENYPDDPL